MTLPRRLLTPSGKAAPARHSRTNGLPRFRRRDAGRLHTACQFRMPCEQLFGKQLAATADQQSELRRVAQQSRQHFFKLLCDLPAVRSEVPHQHLISMRVRKRADAGGFFAGGFGGNIATNGQPGDRFGTGSQAAEQQLPGRDGNEDGVGRPRDQ